MRVLLVTGSFPPEPCGIGDYTQKLADSLAKEAGVDVVVLTTNASPTPETITSILVRSVNSWHFSEVFRIVKVIRQLRPDILHIQYPSQGFSASRLPFFLPLICRAYGITVVQTWHEHFEPKAKLRFFTQIFGANGLVFVRKNFIEDSHPRFRSALKKIHTTTIQNGSALPASNLGEAERNTKRAQYLEGRKRLVVYFGFLYPHKGIESIFEIANSRTDSLVIAGACKEASYVERLSKLAMAKGWTDNVHFSGFISASAAADLMRVADAVLLPFTEGGGEWNTSIHAALAQGTLVITTAASAQGDDESRNLYTAKPSDIVEMRRALDTLAGRRVIPVAIEDTWKIIARKHLAFYQSL